MNTGHSSSQAFPEAHPAVSLGTVCAQEHTLGKGYLVSSADAEV
jgi:hypothetical protein